MGGCISEPIGSVASDTKFEDLLSFTKKKVLRSIINFQGIQTTLFELIDYDLEILKELTGENIQKLLQNKEMMKIGQVCELNLKYPFVERKFVHEELDFRSYHYIDSEDVKFTFKDIKDQTKHSKVFILSDQASSGKSASFMDFAAKLKQQSRLHWVSYIGLNEQRNYFEKLDKTCPNDSFKILLHCIGITSQFEAKIFRKLLTNGRVILLFDGIDEIIPSCTNVLKELFEFLTWRSDYRNQLWISTRPNMSSNSKEILKQQHEFKFAPLKQEDKELFIKGILEFYGIFYKDQQNKIKGDVLYFMSNLGSDKDVDNIFMIQSITEYRVKNSISLSEDNYFEIFANMLESQKASFKIPSLERDNDSLINIWDVHRAVALIKSFPNMKLDLLSIVKKWKKDRKNWTSDVIQRYGYMHGNFDDISSVRFVHKSYSEFFVAQFIINFLFDDNEDMDKAEIKSIVSLFIRIMCNFKSNKICCNFLISYFKLFGYGKKVCGKVKRVIYDNLREIRDPTNSAYPSKDLLRNFAIFMSLDEEMMNKFFKFDEYVNLLDEFVLKGWMETDACTFINAVTDSLGPDWHLKFNKSSAKLLTHKEIKDLEGEYNDIEQIKICEIYRNSNETEAKQRFLNDFDQITCYNGIIQVETIARLRDSLSRDDFIKKCLLRVCYNHITPEALSFIHENIKELCSFYLINKILFDTHPDVSPPLIQCLSIKNPEIFKITADFYIEHKRSWEELQDFFLLRPLSNLFVACTTPIYGPYKEFIKNLFENNKWQLIRKVQGHILFTQNLDLSVKCENSEDLMNWIFLNNIEVGQRIYEKMFKILE
ncbi:unnamed protein product [Chironomus riparius]|uniref:NACHT domain-containing protein n=1 Tax=Chironomus riparius TaxID=315576 RepID=A0A9N9S3M7_9DIPT|nr:unnamed protein product [Chironomus riparius]